MNSTMWFIEDNLPLVLCCSVPLLLLAIPFFWASMYASVDLRRRWLDGRLATVRIGLNELPISRQALEGKSVAEHLLVQAIETTRRKPLDEVQNLTFSPRVSSNSKGDPALDEAGDTLSAIVGGLQNGFGSNGYDENDENYG